MATTTFEPPQWALPVEEREAARQTLAAQGIEWRPLAYHKGPRCCPPWPPSRMRMAVLPLETGHFQRRLAARARLREEIGFSGAVFVYTSKAAGWSLTDPMSDLVEAFQPQVAP